MIKTKFSIVIQRPVDEVFAYVANVENFSHWYGDLITASWLTSPAPVRQGTTFTQTNRFLGREFDTHFEIVNYEPPQKFCVIATSGLAPFGGCYTCEPVEGGTLFTSVAEVEGGGLFNLAGSLLIRAIRRQTEMGLANLQRILDTHADRGN